MGQSSHTTQQKSINWKKQLKTMDYLLSGKEDALIHGILTGDYKLRGLAFTVKHPLHAWNILKTKSTIQTNHDFQTALLEGNALWNFVKRSAESRKIEPMLRVMQQYKINPLLFDSKKILSPDAAESLTPLLQSEENVKLIKKIVLDSRSSNPDWMQITSDTLQLLSDASAQNYITQKEEALGQLVHIISTTPSAGDVSTAITNILPSHLSMKTILESHPKLIDQATALLATQYDKENPATKEQIVSALSSLKEFKGHITTQELLNFVNDAQSKTAPWMTSILAQYHINSEALSQPSIFVKHAAEFKEIIDVLKPQKEQRSIGPLTEKETLAEDSSYKKQSITVLNKLFDILKDPDLTKFAQDNPQFIIGNIIDQVKSNYTIKEQLAKYRINDAELNQILAVAPLLLNKPENLRPVINAFAHNDYLGMTKALLSIAESDPKIKAYFDKTHILFAKIITKILAENNIKIDKDIDITSVIPKMIQHPKELIGIIESYEKGDKKHVIENFLNIAKDPEIQKYFKKNISGLVADTVGINISERLISSFPNLSKPEYAEDIQKIAQLYTQGNTLAMGTAALNFIINNIELQEYFKKNNKQVTETILDLIHTNPALQAALHGRDPGALIQAALDNPTGVKQIIDSGSNKAILGLKAVLNPRLALQGVAFRDLLDGTTAETLRKTEHAGNVVKQKIVDQILDTAASTIKSSDEKSVNMETLIQSPPLSESQQHLLTLTAKDHSLFNGIVIKSKKLDHMELDNVRFVNSTLENVSFEGSSLTNLAFHGAELNNVNFKHSTIDGITLRSMTPLQNHKNFSLEGVTIVGDISNIDLTGINLSNADLSKVTSMKNVNLRNTNLLEATLPDDRGVLRETYNLDIAKMYDPKKLTDPTHNLAQHTQALIIKDQEKFIVDNVITHLEERARALSEPLIPDTQKALISSIIANQTKHDLVSQYICTALNKTPEDIHTHNFHLDGKSIILGTTGDIMDTLYNHRNDNATSIRNAVLAHILSDELIEKLKPHDPLEIRKIITQAISEFTQENPTIDITQSLHYKSTSTALINALQQNSKESTATIKAILNEECHGSGLTSQELSQVIQIAKAIQTNLWITDTETELVKTQLEHACLDIKKTHGGLAMTDMLNEKAQELSGNIKTQGTLTELYYKNSSYTAAGYITGAVYLHDNVKTPQFDTEVSHLVSDKLHNSIQKIIDTIPSKNNTNAPDVIPTAELHIATQRLKPDTLHTTTEKDTSKVVAIRGTHSKKGR